MEKISIVIPNFNGVDLLAKNLPAVIKYCPNCEIIVVDDASTDNSVRLIHKNFKKVKIIRLKKNSGFARASNVGVIASRNNLVLLLNTDVIPRKYFMNPALKYFKNNNVFAVGLEDQSHENGKIIPRGRGRAVFRKGFLMHFADTIERGTTLWTSGGSSIYNRKKFIELNGFDEIYKPYYWEDIDLGFRAWRAGYQCYFEPLAKVDHYHQLGAISKNSSKFKVKSVSYKNQFLFIWKNIHSYYLILQYYFWLPYHMLKALFQFDIAFFYGLFLALFYLPKLLTSTREYNYKMKDKDVLNLFK